MIRMTALILGLLLAFTASAQVTIINTGKIKLYDASGAVVSQHSQIKEAYEAATAHGAGTYRITLPDQTLVYKVPACPVCPPPVDPPPIDPPPVDPPPTPPPPATGAFNLPALAADPITGTVAKPARGKSYVDPVYKVTITRGTQASDGTGDSMRHEYSRRQAFNADNTRYLAQSSNGYWTLYNAQTFAPIRQLKGMAGDCEPLWSPTNPRTLIYTGQNGGKVWWTKDVETDTDTVLFDFTGKTPWPQAESFWTKAEGETSADGKILGLMATRYDSASQSNKIYGLVVLNTATRQIVGTIDASAWGGGFPDHVSTAASGKYIVPSWAYQPTLGTRACPVASFTWANCKLVFKNSEHSDLAYGPNREDYYVVTDYDAGQIRAINLDTLASFNLTTLYPRSGSGYAAHVSGKAFDRPGWVVISTYADFGNYNTFPDPKLEPQYRKVFLAELKPGGQLLSLAHIRTTADGYFGEPQASASHDLSRVIFTSNLGSGTADDYIVTVPFK